MLNARARRLMMSLFTLVLPATAGCLTPYCYPKWDRIGPVQIPPESHIHAFREDVTRHQPSFFMCIPEERIQLKELPLSARNMVPAQSQLSISRGFGLVGLLIDKDGAHVRHD